MDLAVAQNGALTRLFRNEHGAPGVRVRLDGGAQNPLGIGAQLRVMAKGKAGPVREVRAGSGYWSMDGAVTVLPRVAGADAIWIRWPGGDVQTLQLAAGIKELRIKRP